MSRESIYKESVIEFRKQGLGYGEIANKLGITKENARYHCVANGLSGSIGKENFGNQVCKRCGKEFKKKNLNQLFCSEHCRDKESYRRNHPKKEKKIVEKKIKTKETIYCRVCGKEVKQTKFGKTLYCSKDCSLRWIKENPRYTKKCQKCGKEFKTNLIKQMYCSRDCSNTVKKEVVNQYGTLKARENEFLKKFNNKFKDKFIYVGGFVNVDSKVKCKCVKCGKIKMIGAQCARKNYRVECDCVVNKRNEIMQIQKDIQAKEQKEIDKKARYKKYIKSNIDKISIIKLRYRKTQQCQYCGKTFVSTRVSKHCSIECTNKSNEYHKTMRRREKIKTNGHYDWSISIPKLIKRDKVCKLCGKPVDMTDRVDAKGTVIVGSNYPSIDHIIPVSKGGTHTWDNVQLAHVGCNTKKSNTTDVIARIGKAQLSLNI